MKIVRTDLEFVREPLMSPFGFKGAYVSELWQTVVGVKNSDGIRATGLGVQSVLWSDASVFKNSTVVGGNLQMLSITEYALKLLENTDFVTPIEALEEIKPKVYEYAKQVTNNSKLRPTFALNALVSVDNALWQLYAKEKNTQIRRA